jgi:uncharacterized membrane protein
MAAFLLPTTSLVSDRLLRRLSAASLTSDPASAQLSAVYDAILLRLALFVLGVHAAVLAGLGGLLSGRGWAIRIVPILLGLTMISVGNLLPRTRPNLAIGIRTSRTLSDEHCWRVTHRLVGYVVVGSGCAIALGAMVVPAPVGPRLILAVGPAAALAIVVITARAARHARA